MIEILFYCEKRHLGKVSMPMCPREGEFVVIRGWLYEIVSVIHTIHGAKGDGYNWTDVIVKQIPKK